MLLASQNTKTGRVIDQNISCNALVALSRLEPELFVKCVKGDRTHLFLVRNGAGQATPVFSKCLQYSIGSQQYFITDLRPFGGTNPDLSRAVVLRNRLEAELFVFRAAMEDAVGHYGVAAIRDRFIESVSLYGWYVSALLASSLNLHPGLLGDVSLVAQSYYLNLLGDTIDWDLNRPAITLRLAGINKSSVHDVSAITDQLVLTRSIGSMIDAIIAVTNTPRTENLNYKTFLAITAGSYFGFGQQTLPMMALESPCTWIPFVSVVYRDKNKSRCKAAGVISNYSTKAEQFSLRKKLYGVLDATIPEFDTTLLTGAAR